MGKTKTKKTRRAEFVAVLDRFQRIVECHGYNDGWRADPARNTDDAFKRSQELYNNAATTKAELVGLFARALRSRGTV